MYTCELIWAHNGNRICVCWTDCMWYSKWIASADRIASSSDLLTSIKFNIMQCILVIRFPISCEKTFVIVSRLIKLIYVKKIVRINIHEQNIKQHTKYIIVKIR